MLRSSSHRCVTHCGQIAFGHGPQPTPRSSHPSQRASPTLPLSLSLSLSHTHTHNGCSASSGDYFVLVQVPVIEVEGNVAVCNGGGGALGHPVEYIQLNTVVPGEIGECKYCGLRYVHKSH